MITGFRWHNGGAQKLYDIVPDLSTFGKAFANGFSVSALAGRREYMRLGGLDHHDRPRVFLLSTTHGAETHALAAAIATMQVYQHEGVIEHLYRQGERLRRETEQAIAPPWPGAFVKVVGKPCCLSYATLDQDGRPSQALRTLFLQETIRRGVLMPSLVVSYSHSDDDIDLTIEAIDGALAVYRQALDDGVERYLVGRPSQTVYRPYNLPEVLRRQRTSARGIWRRRGDRAPWRRIGALASALWLRPDPPPSGADHGSHARRLGNLAARPRLRRAKPGRLDGRRRRTRIVPPRRM